MLVIQNMPVVATKEEELKEVKLKDAPPSLLIVGDLPQYDNVLIVGEGEVLLEICGDSHLAALKCLLYS